MGGGAHRDTTGRLDGLRFLADRAGWRIWRAASWTFRSRWRMLVGAWLTGFFWIGQATAALADDGLINGPDLGTAGGQTVFEQYGPDRFALYLQLSDSNHGAPYVSESMWNILRAIESALMYLIGALARGAITSMQWMLNLHLYSDNSAQLDATVRALAAQVFWPLFGATMAIGALSAYGRMKREGGGSLFTDASWLVAASIFAGAFALAPSSVMGQLDDARTAIADAAMTGYAANGTQGPSAAGFPTQSLPRDQAGASRQLADAMWNVYVVTPWCYVNFNSMLICKDVGHDYIAGDARWNAMVDWMDGKNGGNSNDKNGAYCPPELNAHCDWIRGQSFGRLGAILFVVLVTIPLVAMLLVLVLYGIMAIVGFLLLILIGVFFVLGWMIPGRPRQMGVRWFEEVLGALIHSIIITAVLGSVMVLDSILNAKIPTYGFFMVGLLNLATFIVGFRMRGRLENITGLGAGGSASPFSGYMAMRALGGIGKGAFKMTRGTIKAGASATPILAGAAMGMGRTGGQLVAAGVHGADSAHQLLRSLPNNLLRSHPAPSGGGGLATPYRRPGSATAATGPGRRKITASPRPGHGSSGGTEPLQLPPGQQSTRGRDLALEPARTSVEPGPDGIRRFVGPGTMTPPRMFTPSTIGPRAAANARMNISHGTPSAVPARPTAEQQVASPQPTARSYQPSPRSTPSGSGPGRADLASPPTRPAADDRTTPVAPFDFYRRALHTPRQLPRGELPRPTAPTTPQRPRPVPRPPRQLPTGALPKPGTPRPSNGVSEPSTPAPSTPPTPPLRRRNPGRVNGASRPDRPPVPLSAPASTVAAPTERRSTPGRVNGADRSTQPRTPPTDQGKP